MVQPPPPLPWILGARCVTRGPLSSVASSGQPLLSHTLVPPSSKYPMPAPVHPSSAAASPSRQRVGRHWMGATTHLCGRAVRQPGVCRTLIPVMQFVGVLPNPATSNCFISRRRLLDRHRNEQLSGSGHAVWCTCPVAV